VSAVLAAATAFNLVCLGATFIGDIKKENESPFIQTFRIDLDAQRWCAGNCETTSRIFSVSDTMIMLKLEHDKEAGDESFISLNRENGVILDRTRFNHQFFSMKTGTCERVPFTGFPAKRF